MPRLVTVDALAFTKDEENSEDGKETETTLDGGNVLDSDELTADRGESMYVQLFQEILTTVLEHESFLLSESERKLLSRYSDMPYAARYLLVRLSLRKRAKWHRYDALYTSYASEIGPHLKDAMAQLCVSFDESIPPPPKQEDAHALQKKVEVIEISDDEEELKVDEELTVIDVDAESVAEDAEPSACVPRHSPTLSESSSKKQEGVRGAVTEPPITFFAQDDESTSIEDLIAVMSWDELKSIGKSMKVLKPGMNRKTLAVALLASASRQTTLFFAAKPMSAKQASVSSSQLCIKRTSDGRPKDQMRRLREILLGVTGKCIRIHDQVFVLFQRLSLIFFRSTSIPTSPILPLLLSRTNKRSYPKYTATRTTEIFTSREAFLAFESALELEASLDEGFEALGRVEAAERAVGLWEGISEKWRVLVQEKGDERRPPGLERFEEGHVLTRIVCKAAQAFGTLKQYEREMSVLEELLAQRRWRQGRRGAWYDRMALILMTHSGGTPEKLADAMEVVIRGLEDPLTHIVYRPGLQRRLTRLENRLKIPDDARHVCDGKLKTPDITVISGRRIATVPLRAKRAGSLFGPILREGSVDLLSTQAFFTQARSTPMSASTFKDRSVSVLSSKGAVSEQKTREAGKKSAWKGRDEVVSVEQLALEHYEDQGFRGYHSEGRVVSTIFTLLFWSVLFAPVPGAFETPYQTAPLDLAHDTFFSARKNAIDDRLKDIKDGKARDILEEIDKRERGENSGGTWVVGVNWDMFPREDLLEIVDCIGGEPLSVICRLLCEEYGHRRSGVPDLLIWKASTGEARFVEVKGPGDTLMENQKVWIDVLLGASMPVEVCRVEDDSAPKPPKAAPKSKAKTTKGKGKGKGKAKAPIKSQAVIVSSDEEPEEEDSVSFDGQVKVEYDSDQEVHPSSLPPSTPPAVAQKRTLRSTPQIKAADSPSPLKRPRTLLDLANGS
ncbi:hypothetical protein BOTBODRAFT_125157 [Botryobasidium botryosum FD-172 SS1]|uniref:Fanconi-associated nuclease n=1 Tax=Botryobasidium botryosum (strain FD-172 SS1) TaxID=930990 RepID=A0A067MYH5_BOTB1|nr:hypothetical protein BOTBODRAFT_125157 [Botryobasidium botryosum FD-172 SS1]